MATKETKTKKVAPAKTAKVEDKKVEKKVEKKAEPKAKKVEKVEEKKTEKVVPTEAICFVRDCRVTPRKVRYVADYIRGMSVKEALAILSRVNKSACTPLAKAIKSAAANATNNFGMDGDSLYVAEIQASDGVRMKRFTPRAKGSASPVIKRMSNIRVVVKERK
jgi:large subunit ribosomal protein L22